MLEKTYDDRTWRKTPEDVKSGIENIDDYIAEARTLEITSFKNMPAWPHVIPTSSSKDTIYASYKLENKDEYKDEYEEPEHDDERILEQALDAPTPDKDSGPSAPESVVLENSPTLEASKTSAYANQID